MVDSAVPLDAEMIAECPGVETDAEIMGQIERGNHTLGIRIMQRASRTMSSIADGAISRFGATGELSVHLIAQREERSCDTPRHVADNIRLW